MLILHHQTHLLSEHAAARRHFLLLMPGRSQAFLPAHPPQASSWALKALLSRMPDSRTTLFGGWGGAGRDGRIELDRKASAGPLTQSAIVREEKENIKKNSRRTRRMVVGWDASGKATWS